MFGFFIAFVTLMGSQFAYADDGVASKIGQSVDATQDVRIFVFPSHPRPGQPVRVVGVSRNPNLGFSLRVLAEGAVLPADRTETWGYSPHAVCIEFSGMGAGTYLVERVVNGSNEVFQGFSFIVTEEDGSAEDTDVKVNWPTSVAWPVTADWSAAYEDLFSVFVARLFYVPRGAAKGWRPLDGATQDPFRNILYGALGYDEDNPSAPVPVVLSPDCADAPMQVRAYFAWKMGLPLLGNECVRGSSKTGPWCYNRYSNLDALRTRLDHPVARFNRFAATTLSYKTHAGVYRTLPEDEQSMFYPIELTAESIRPGTVFVDAGGHIVLVSQWEPQTDNHIGALFGVDAHPDFTVTHKGFFKGTFVFNANVPTDGFKGFRPVVRHGDALRFLSNDEVGPNSGFPTYSAVQAELTEKNRFYYLVQKALNPRQIDPQEMLNAKIGALQRAVEERVNAVQIGVDYMRTTYWETMEMPSGAAIFQTVGPWEMYSTPARDMRLFLTMDSVATFPGEVMENIDLYEMNAGVSAEEVEQFLRQAVTEALEQIQFSYQRSDGSEWTLRLSDVLARSEKLEMAYNPNDCPEVRWGAALGSEEMTTCNRHAPGAQRFKMKQYRKWFVDRRRPDQR